MSPEEVLKSIEAEAPAKGYPIIGPEKGVILDGVVSKHKPSRILEVGTLVGYSAIRMARLIGREGEITCVEVNEAIAQTAGDNLKAAGLSDRVEIIIGDAKKVIPKLNGSYDMMFIDAAKEEYFGYLKAGERLLHKGSVVVADNAKVFAKEMADYLEYVRTSGKYDSKYREAPSGSDAVEVSIMR